MGPLQMRKHLVLQIVVYLPVWWGGLGDTSLSFGRLSNCSKDGTPPPPIGGYVSRLISGYKS
jgi:hypothetical protein